MVIEVLTAWFYAFGSRVETKDEEVFHFALMQEWVASKAISSGLRTFVEEFIEEKFKPMVPNLCHRYFMFRCVLWPWNDPLHVPLHFCNQGLGLP